VVRNRRAHRWRSSPVAEQLTQRVRRSADDRGAAHPLMAQSAAARAGLLKEVERSLADPDVGSPHERRQVLAVRADLRAVIEARART
jgi:hypothetical protein